MSAFHHNSPNAERLARAWHFFGFAASSTQVVGAIVSYALIHALRLGIVRIGIYVYLMLVWGCIAVGVNALFGALWHLWAANEHSKALRPKLVPPDPISITAGELAARRSKRYPKTRKRRR